MFLDEVFKAHKEQKPQHWQIDTRGQQGYIYKDILEAREQRNEHTLTISPFDPKRESKANVKDEDIQACINPMANGEIYVHISAKLGWDTIQKKLSEHGMKELAVEWRNFPHGLTKDLIDMVGKLNKYRWSRRERESEQVLMEREGDAYQEQGRSPVTGY